MADALKVFFNATLVRELAGELSEVHAAFPAHTFTTQATRGLNELELVARAQHIREALRQSLPQPYPEAIDILVRSLGPPLPEQDVLGQGMAPFRYLPHVQFVAEYGLEHFELSMDAQHALTRRFSAEYSIRPFIERYPERTLKQLKAWTKDPSSHVRRLVSEGTRTRLPWAGRLRGFQEDPSPVVALLELLKDDPSSYVRRSVANNLNDIGKDHPGLLVEICARWMKGASGDRVALVKHALRSAVKRGDADALAVLGFGGAAQLELSAQVSPKRVKRGGSVEVEVELRNPGTRVQKAVVDLAVHFVKARGEARPKVFKLKSVELKPGASLHLRKSISFKEMTTRKHHPGRHTVEILINGVPQPAGAVELLD